MRDSDTIDFGIDLGTTNSAIAVVEGGDVVMIKSNDGWDITPSAVWMPKPDLIHVGRTARERVETDPDNAAAEFKLEMGLADARRDFVKAGRQLTPPQLSAEVLKSLRADAAHHQGSSPDFAVITVPAAFALNQNKATTEAATLAGFNAACPLVQEPTAAAFAYGFHDAADRGYWMVFDFGGGTFDAAVVSKRDGDLRVLNHLGDPYLGGKLIDWAIVERLLAPAAARDLGLRDFRRDNPAWRVNLGKLKAAAEEAKIQLSRREQIPLTVDLTVADGSTETFEYLLRGDELDAVAEPFYVRAINLCRAALKEAALDVDDMDRLLLVGGVTLAPGLRKRLADPSEGIGIQIDTSLDPTTVVARGAAIFAGTLRRPQTASLATVAPGEFVGELAYEPSVTTRTPTVGGKLTSSTEVDWTEYHVTLSNPDGQPPFRTARIRLNANGAFATEVDIDAHTTSRFVIELTDGTGTRRRLTPDTMSITHREVEFGGVRLAQSLGIQLADRAFAPLLAKGATLPTRVREVFHTSSALRRSDTEAVVRIPVVQGERSRGDRNREVGMLEIRPRDVRIDLPAGSEVEVTFDVDASSLVSVIADVPLVQAQFEAEIDLDNVRTATPQALQVQLNDVERRLTSLRESSATSRSPAAQENLDRLDEESTVVILREQVGAAKVDVGAAAAAEERLRDLQARLDDIEDATELPALIERLHEGLDEATVLVNQSGTASDRQELAELRRRGQAAADAGDATALQAQIDRVTSLIVEMERRSPDWPVKLFYTLQSMLPASQDVAALTAEGQRAIAARDSRALDAVNQRMIRLLPAEAQETVIGLRKA
ncbi:Hsp70 protein [Actinoalloteichus hymeniacidonis]|uniref:Hsp70 protein n=2 Tax=Actinoalloteichus hymeniacidonis TaxID=340345 RepID=A0AAC9HSB7_9PSEU|nr:Hsp70 protein [Actinoalloteichus hymeniacidonis]